MPPPRELSSWPGHYQSLVEFVKDFMEKQSIIDLVRKICGPLDPALICAIIEQESSFDQWAIRYEPAFYTKYVEPISGLTSTEAHGRAFSWGLLQCMGQSARECGFKGPLPQLCEPETGIRVGCELFTRKMTASRGQIHQALLYWNGGGNEAYPGQVMARIAKFV